jgi:hypothetical protein
MAHKSATLALWIVLGLGVGGQEPPAAPQPAAPWIPAEEQARLVQSVRFALRLAWTVSPGPLGQIPDGWRSLDARTFPVEGRNGADTFRVWFVAPDWIGIRPESMPGGAIVWSGIGADEQTRKYKAITARVPIPDDYAKLRQVPAYAALSAIGMASSPSAIAGNGRMGVELFADRADELDEQTQALVRRFCTTRACSDEAVDSLIALGVPARTLTLDCAEHGSGRAQANCAALLGFWHTRVGLPVLQSVVANPATSAEARRSAAFALWQIADPSSGPALARALQVTRPADREAARTITMAIERVRHQPAAPDVLARLEFENEPFWKMTYAKALASLRHAAAVPAIEKLCETTTITAEWLIAKSLNGSQDSRPELALLRITAPWGRPERGLRLLIVAPDRPVDRRLRFASLIENVGDSEMPELRHRPGVWIVDGQEYSSVDTVKWDGTMNVHPNEVDVRAVDLSNVRALSTPGTHSVQYRLLGATSNIVTVTVPQASARAALRSR